MATQVEGRGPLIEWVEMTIAEDGTSTGIVPLKGMGALRLTIPSAWTAADLAVKSSHDGITSGPLLATDGTAIEITGIVAGAVIDLEPAIYGKGFHSLEFVSSDSQDAERTLILEVRPLQ